MLGRPADMILAAETHVKEGDANGMLKAIKAAGFDATVAHAKQSAKSTKGSHAGMIAGCRTRWRSDPLVSCRDPDGLVARRHDVTGRSVRLAGVEVLVLTAYFQCDAGLFGPNSDICEEVEYLTRCGRRMFILLADFNIPVDKLTQDCYQGTSPSVGQSQCRRWGVMPRLW